MIAKTNDKLVSVVGISLITIGISFNIRTISRVVSTFWSRLYLQFVIASRKDASQQHKRKTVSAIYIYPVKSLRGVECQTATLGERGFLGDRRFMIVTPAPLPLWGSFGPKDPTHRFMTQRQCPSLATVFTVVKNNTISLSSHLLSETYSETFPQIPPPGSSTYLATLWSDTVRVQDMGDAAANFLQKIVDQDTSIPDELKSQKVRLVVQCPDDGRSPKDTYVPSSARSWTGKLPSVSLADGFPILIANEASLEELNRRLKEKGKKPLNMSNFRPNIIVSGCEAFEEDRWKVIRIAGTLFHVVKGCPRCKQSCTDQITGEVSEEPLETLAEFRAMTKDQEQLYFAQNVVPSANAIGITISKGDTVEILQVGDPVWDD